MLDLLIYRETAPMGEPDGDHHYMVCGKTCLAGDIFGEARFSAPLQVGDRISIRDAAAYTMVKKNWFNGVHMPSIAIKEADGPVRVVREFSRSEEHTSELQSLMRTSYAVFCLKKKIQNKQLVHTN